MKQNSVPQNHADENLMFHPYSIMMALMLFGLSGLFISLTASYVYTRTVMNVPPIQVPALFLVNTLILIGSSYSMIRAKRCYLADDTKGYQDNLRYTIYLSLLFMAMQTVAWIWLFRNNVNLGTSTTAAYLYVISFVHLAHVVAGLPFLAMFYRAAKKTHDRSGHRPHLFFRSGETPSPASFDGLLAFFGYSLGLFGCLFDSQRYDLIGGRGRTRQYFGAKLYLFFTELTRARTESWDAGSYMA